MTRLSTALRDAADALVSIRPATAEWLRDEAVHAAEAEHLAQRTSDLAMTAVDPAYRPSTLRAYAVVLDEVPPHVDVSAPGLGITDVRAREDGIVFVRFSDGRGFSFDPDIAAHLGRALVAATAKDGA